MMRRKALSDQSTVPQVSVPQSSSDFTERLHTRRSKYHQIFCGYWKQILPLALLISISVFGGIILYHVELASDLPANDELVDDTTGCVASGGYWSTIVFVNGVSSAAGIGSNSPCTGWGRVVTVIYTIVGIPLALTVLNQVGGAVAIVCHLFYVNLYLLYGKYSKRLQCHRSRSKVDVELETGKPLIRHKTTADMLEEMKMDPDLIDTPVWFVTAITIGWILFCGFVFASKNDWDFGIGSYFSFTLLTVGVLADVTEMGYVVSFFTMLSIFIGLSLLSNMVSTIQSNADRTVTRVEMVVQEEIKQALENPDPNSLEDPDERIVRILKEMNAPSYMSKLIPRKQMNNLVKQQVKRSSLTSVSTQTDDLKMTDQSQQFFPSSDDVSVMAVPNTRANSSQFDFVEMADECEGYVYVVASNDKECTARPTTRTVKAQFPALRNTGSSTPPDLGPAASTKFLRNT